VIVAWRRCWCGGPGDGHTTVACREPGCGSVWHNPAHRPEGYDSQD